MATRGLVVMAVATAAAACAAGVLVWQRGGSGVPAPGAAERLFPGLEARINDVASLTVQKGDQTYTIARAAAGNADAASGAGAWVLADRGGFPASFEKVKQNIVGIALLTPLEQKTSNPALYEKIGVQDPGPAAVNTALVTLKDAHGNELASVIFGNSRFGGDPAVYVRRRGEPESWLCKGSFDWPAHPTGFTDPQIMSLARERIRSVTITHPDGSAVVVSRATPSDANFSVAGVPEGRELKYETVANPIGSALSFMSLEDVRPRSEVEFPADATVVAEFVAFDGLTVTVRTTKKDGKTWATFDVSHAPGAAGGGGREGNAGGDAGAGEPAGAESGDASDESSGTAGAGGVAPADVPEPQDAPAESGDASAAPASEGAAKEAAELHARVSPWAFQLPDYKATSLVTTMEELLKAPAGGTTGGVPGGTGESAADGAAHTEHDGHDHGEPAPAEPEPSAAPWDEPEGDDGR